VAELYRLISEELERDERLEKLKLDYLANKIAALMAGQVL
jgi:hypothetical protein